MKEKVNRSEHEDDDRSRKMKEKQTAHSKRQKTKVKAWHGLKWIGLDRTGMVWFGLV